MLNKDDIWAILKKELPKQDNKELNRIAVVLDSAVREHVKEVKAGVAKAKASVRPEANDLIDDLGDIDTLEGFLELLKTQSVKGNSQVMKLYSELKGFERASRDLEINMVDYKDAPEHFFVSKPPQNVGVNPC